MRISDWSSDVCSSDLRDGFPKWRGSTSLTWKLGQFTAGAFANYVGSVVDDDISIGGQKLLIDDYITANLYRQYDLKRGVIDGTQFRIGARNITHDQPPIDSSASGDMGSPHSPITRPWIV